MSPSCSCWCAAVLASCLVACQAPPALVAEQRARVAVTALQGAFAKSVDAEKSAVLATTDEESEAFAAESRKAAADVEHWRTELRLTLTETVALEKLTAFDATWSKVAALDAQILPLAVANTNLKAARLSAQGAAAATDRLVDALTALAAKTTDARAIRDLDAAAVAALRLHSLEAPHIAASEDAVMTQLEARMHELESLVTAGLAKERQREARKPAPELEVADRAWAELVDLNAQVLRLSRQNSNVVSFELSTHAKRQATVACQAALEQLAAHLQAPSSTGTR